MALDDKGDFFECIKNRCLVVAEIGQNHQGDIELAKKLILVAKEAGADCVKFQKCCLTSKFTEAALSREYDSPHSFGKTYGEHKQHLEFSIEQFKELQAYAEEIGILFASSAMDEDSFKELQTLNLPFIKIGSGDANNFRLLKMAAQIETPIIISTGMQEMSTIEKIVSIMDEHKKKNFALLHCVSSYPTKPEDSTLRLITLYKKQFPDVVIGYSGHGEGFLISVGAVMLGSKIVERHLTVDKALKGTDHCSSILPSELKHLVKLIRQLEDLNAMDTPDGTFEIINYLRELGVCTCDFDIDILENALSPHQQKVVLPCEFPCRDKLGKSIVYASELPAGHVLTEDDLNVKVTEPFGVSAEKTEKFIGKTLKVNVHMDQSLKKTDFED